LKLILEKIKKIFFLGREWRQARLQSMDVESRRTGDLVKIIANATTTEASAST